MRRVSSSNIAAVGYDPDTSKLVVEFHNGSTYEYENVPEDEFDSLVRSSSVGSYFQNNIRNSFDSKKL